MNCANHPDKAVAKYCRTCGKPLCNECVREVMGIAYCENCLAERVTGSAPGSPYSAPAAPIASPALKLGRALTVTVSAELPRLMVSEPVGLAKSV